MAKSGLSASFRRARILRYGYASAWQGPYMIDKPFDSIVQGLLDTLKAYRRVSNSVLGQANHISELTC